ncbi:MAG: hypothetical protein HUJ29_08790 [Gammaproteobacteria bacterium]|nr:hypothetical protein [Gammaproteobacteria bacterium]
MRDAMDGMEQLASMYAYGRLPDDLEILSVGPEPLPEPAPVHLAPVIHLNPTKKTKPNQSLSSKRDRPQGSEQKYNKIIML